MLELLLSHEFSQLTMLVFLFNTWVPTAYNAGVLSHGFSQLTMLVVFFEVSHGIVSGDGEKKVHISLVLSFSICWYVHGGAVVSSPVVVAGGPLLHCWLPYSH